MKNKANKILDVNDVCRILNRKPTYCYRVMRDLNKELEEQGFYTNSGRIPAKYFYKRLGIEYESEEK